MGLPLIVAKFRSKLLIGTTLCLILSIALFYLFQTIHLFIAQFGDSLPLEIAVFGSISIGCVFGLYLLGSEKLSRNTSNGEEVPPPNSVDELQILGLKFFEGFALGFLSKKKEDTSSRISMTKEV